MNEETNIWTRIKSASKSIKDLTDTNLMKMQQRGYVPAKWHYDFVNSPDSDLTYEELRNLKNK